MKLLMQGLTNKEIARALGTITEATIKVHMKSLIAKLRVKNRTQLALAGLCMAVEYRKENVSADDTLIWTGVQIALNEMYKLTGLEKVEHGSHYVGPDNKASGGTGAGRTYFGWSGTSGEPIDVGGTGTSGEPIDVGGTSDSGTLRHDGRVGEKVG